MNVYRDPTERRVRTVSTPLVGLLVSFKVRVSGWRPVIFTEYFVNWLWPHRKMQWWCLKLGNDSFLVHLTNYHAFRSYVGFIRATDNVVKETTNQQGTVTLFMRITWHYRLRDLVTGRWNCIHAVHPNQVVLLPALYGRAKQTSTVQRSRQGTGLYW